jgi:decaprenylphospho-beta-D-ribofuranose 2-oxidase
VTVPPDPLPDIRSEVEKLNSYSGLNPLHWRVYYPMGLDQLRQIFTHAKEKGQKVTLRAGGHSFDSQPLEKNILVSLGGEGFNWIGEVEAGNTLRVGAGATWGAILAKLEAGGRLPAVTVTTCAATAGGTLSGDCLSRFSPAYGKEGVWIKSFDLLTVDGQLLTCTRPLAGNRQSWTLGEQAFCGAISGLGYLGAVVAVTYDVLALDQRHGPIGVETQVEKFKGESTFADLVERLVPVTREMYSESCDPNDPTKHDAIYSALYASKRARSRKALLFMSKITTDTRRRRMPLFRPKILRRVLVEWMMRRPLLCRLLWLFFYVIARTKRPYIDDLDGYTFFMDGNARAKRLGKNLGLKMQTIQQTFVVPFNPKTEDWDDGRRVLASWLEYGHGVFKARKLAPTLWDVLFLPEDDLFPLSATAESPGFVVSYAFETSNSKKIARIEAAFEEMSDHLWTQFRGRVYLVKNVRANPATLAAMYGRDARAFFDLKQELDPHCVFRNEFLDRTFGGLLNCTPYQPPAKSSRPSTGRFRHTPAEEAEEARQRPER